MAHKYYCTHCGRELNQDLVLLNMEPALTGSVDEQFEILKFRITKKDFDEILAAGTVGDLGYVHYDLPFEKFMAFVSDKNNLGDVVIKSLTLEEVTEYLDFLRKSEFDDDDPEDGMADLVGIPGMPVAEQVMEDEGEQELPAAIEALREKDTKNTDRSQTDKLLESDLSRVHNLFAATGYAHLEILPMEKTADTGDKVLYGYQACVGGRRFPVNARHCRYCSTQVFEQAGNAEHRSIAFIGQHSSGKTSTILAMTHYAENGARSIKTDDEIWKNSEKIPGIDFIQVINKGSDLAHDLALYNQGIAPKKTEVGRRENAYSATFWIQNSRDEKFILTLMDLPGELCNEQTGRIDGEKILNEFPVALACDVFLVCFDTKKAKGGAANTTVMNVCAWANEFQMLRQGYKINASLNEGVRPEDRITEDCFAPIMLLFTKCGELEDVKEKETVKEKTAFNTRRIYEMYSLKDEREFIERNEVYKDVGDLIQKFDNLKEAYFARLRCSPYGFEALTEEKIQEDLKKKLDQYIEKNPGEYTDEQKAEIMKTLPRLNEDASGKTILPRPIHIDMLMKWLLTISGCVPADAEYCENPAEPDVVYRLKDTYVSRALYRTKPPVGRNKAALDEAMCRAYLFENYTEADEDLIVDYRKALNPGVIPVWPIAKKPETPAGDKKSGGKKAGFFGWLKGAMNGGED